MKRKFLKISYEPEADVLRIEMRRGKLYDTIELGNFIIHLDKNLKPLYMEILKAKDFLLKTNQSVLRQIKEPVAVL
ncbi:MAG: hypothetical protein COT33_01635 [Candidatus Nealsonbacteria bacterium CG08_land_8_20_14_0_20_38_20]|uniref:DUF2283 domain-containing protein n=1 Tax=Candidatus Nealsonbacteria bacterium CG08_land_8_20_14_0_20_38_20 TaxID=1974705 RepID=A0A2H0YLY2_9BACT|nr:MAG: hypothetical protein COT33_01635 [Candidatus Nealsonbacteria bacterium CG08_land_8_20_14_0_20_38_20]